MIAFLAVVDVYARFYSVYREPRQRCGYSVVDRLGRNGKISFVVTRDICLSAASGPFFHRILYNNVELGACTVAIVMVGDKFDHAFAAEYRG